jgi:hypothetical protein
MGAIRQTTAIFLVLTCGLQTRTSAAGANGLSWKSVRTLKPGTELRLEGYGKRLFLAADKTAVTVLNLTDDRLPRSLRESLREMAAQRPDLLTAGVTHKPFEDPRRHVRGADGDLFVDDLQVSELAALVETVSRASLQGAGAIIVEGQSDWKPFALSGGIVAGVILTIFGIMAAAWH